MDVMKVSRVISLLLAGACVMLALSHSIWAEGQGNNQLSEDVEAGKSRITFPEIVAWLVVGALAGSVAGMLVTRKKKGFGRLKNVMLGLLGAAIGGTAINLFKIDLGLGEVRIGFDELLAAFVCSLILLAVVWWAKRRRKAKREKAVRIDRHSGTPPSS